MAQERKLTEWVKEMENLWDKWAFADMNGFKYLTKDLFLLAIQDKNFRLKPITKPVIKEDDLNDLIAMLSFGGFLSDRIAVKEAAIKIKRFIENMNFSLKPESISDSEGWISADIEPEQGKRVLCLTNTGRMEVGYFHDAEWESDTSQSFEYRGYTITHWQPLPRLPAKNQHH